MVGHIHRWLVGGGQVLQALDLHGVVEHGGQLGPQCVDGMLSAPPAVESSVGRSGQGIVWLAKQAAETCWRMRAAVHARS